MDSGPFWLKIGLLTQKDLFRSKEAVMKSFLQGVDLKGFAILAILSREKSYLTADDIGLLAKGRFGINFTSSFLVKSIRRLLDKGLIALSKKPSDLRVGECLGYKLTKEGRILFEEFRDLFSLI